MLAPGRGKVFACASLVIGLCLTAALRSRLHLEVQDLLAWQPRSMQPALRRMHPRLMAQTGSRPPDVEAAETRGKTAIQRLRRLDQFLSAFDSGLLQASDSVALDLGYGCVPITTMEWFQRLGERYSHIRMVGVESDAERVAAAAPMAKEGLIFRRGDFNLPLEPGERVRLLRAMNVLRQYDESAAVSAHQQLIAQIEDGGLIAEGTCDPLGRIMVVALLRRKGAAVYSEGLLFATSFHDSFDPRAFQAVLPKHLIHRVVEGEPIHTFFEAWAMAAKTCRCYAVYGTRQHFVAAAENLAGRIEGVVARRSWLRNGWLLWKAAPYP
eukprot:gnl/TRDRNA2_/TRDRNA2_93581_c1_seq1.p1 gnl/TRDRNA2_/TRDRNA2_93581_c1~~gnl/TRDRNA2_/TRDRNA2_93581_c1_seq1.p1  ORF type:complete len:325 (-),score=31.06 gnl/TRDRNA2_/TRDRNA2_93581_c1_seq1:191-1165(-)